MSPVHIVALGGSLLRPEEAGARSMWMGQLRQLMVHLEGNGRKIGLVVGGGLPAREGIELVNEIIADPHRLDEVGIAATRLNATVLQQLLLDIGCDVAPSVPHTVEEARSLLDDHSIVVMGGTVPGHTTDTVAVKLAAVVHARHCVIATNVSHVFTKDPRHHDDAEALTELTLAELASIVGVGESLEPGASAVVDPVAVETAIEAGLDLAVLDGRDVSRIDDALDGKPFEGTLIKA
ncbi:MAG TPA: UMP kinase [Candidatus Poseidoniales archaeon]|nr:MAG TPA: UMP kinase [Candidatus Poseidoniales archaeon]HII28008.1 UMP kinase [Poseidonia sp.]